MSVQQQSPQQSPQEPLQEPLRDPRAVSATGVFLGVEPQVAVTSDGKVVIPVDLAEPRR